MVHFLPTYRVQRLRRKKVVVNGVWQVEDMNLTFLRRSVRTSPSLVEVVSQMWIETGGQGNIEERKRRKEEALQ